MQDSNKNVNNIKNSLNKNSIKKRSNENVNSINSITNELILKYDDKFNQLHNKILNLNSSIMNKEELIIKEDELISQKESKILALEILIFFIILFGISLIFYALKKIDINRLIIYSVAIVFFYILIIWYYIYSSFNNKSLADKLKSLEVSMKSYAHNALKTTIKDGGEKRFGLKCPAKCQSINNPQPEKEPLISYASPTLKTDSQLNVWENGDMPTDLYTSKRNPGSKFYEKPNNIPQYYNRKNNPKEVHSTTYPRSTYYKCEWLGGDTNKGDLPNVESKKYSSIPCNYRQNFEEKGRYICLRDPNNLSSEQFKKVCDDVSNNYVITK